ncbi:MAG: bifunctional 4-hydroxy-2-oxoglutarate aldolase/2-dehydro-3-deoxy-phosphogluconate aldolase [Parafilimonas sp.]
MIKTQENIISIIQEQGVIPLFYNDDEEVSIAIADALYNAGIRIVEYTNRGSNAVKNFEALTTLRDKQWPELILCAGTVKFLHEAKAFIHAGADFIICPGVIPDVAKVVHEAGLLWVPGCMSSTEIIIAEQNGAKLVKLFPGSLLGPAYLKAIKEIFPGLLFMPTGGVDITEENLSAWFKAGVVAVGLGSKLISKDVMLHKNYTAVNKLAAKALALIKKIKDECHLK